MFSAYASSSIADSSANEPLVSPGARMNVGVPIFKLHEPVRRRLIRHGVQHARDHAEVSVQSSNIDVVEILSWRMP